MAAVDRTIGSPRLEIGWSTRMWTRSSRNSAWRTSSARRPCGTSYKTSPFTGRTTTTPTSLRILIRKMDSLVLELEQLRKPARQLHQAQEQHLTGTRIKGEEQQPTSRNSRGSGWRAPQQQSKGLQCPSTREAMRVWAQLRVEVRVGWGAGNRPAGRSFEHRPHRKTTGTENSARMLPPGSCLAARRSRSSLSSSSTITAQQLITRLVARPRRHHPHPHPRRQRPKAASPMLVALLRPPLPLLLSLKAARFSHSA